MTHTHNLAPAATSRVHLSIGALETTVRVEQPGQAPIVRRLALGTQRPGGPAFTQHPPVAVALEAAIAGVEDEVMPLARQVPPGGHLVTQDALAASLGMNSQERLELDLIEQRFNTLADAAMGSRSAAGALPADPRYAGYLLILREFMHHVGFDALHVEPESHSN
jgi:hypothetical protein